MGKRHHSNPVNEEFLSIRKKAHDHGKVSDRMGAAKSLRWTNMSVIRSLTSTRKIVSRVLLTLLNIIYHIIWNEGRNMSGEALLT